MQGTIETEINLSTHAEQVVYWSPNGSGTSLIDCGALKYRAHERGPAWDVTGFYQRCHRPECPSCWDKRGGWLDRAEKRILDSMDKAFKPGWERQLRETIIAPWIKEGDESMWQESWFKRQMIQELRKRAGSYMASPGAWVFHHMEGGREMPPDQCPERDHMHVFFVASRDAWVPDGMKIRIPGLTAALRIAQHCAVAADSPGMKTTKRKKRKVAIIGWFGRRIGLRLPPIGSPIPPPEKEKTFHCRACNADVPRREWVPVFPRGVVLESEGSWVIDGGDLDFLMPDWVTGAE